MIETTTRLCTQFVARPGTALYEVTGLTAEEAEGFGCPGADVMLTGRLGSTVGNLMATGSVPGRSVRVPGWTAARRGVRAVFVPWGPEAEPLSGYLGD